MRHGWKILTVGLAFAGLTALAAPAQAHVARIPCDPGKLCIYEGRDGTGEMLSFGPADFAADLSKISCPSCGPNKFGERGTWNDQMSSYINRSNRTWMWSYETNGVGTRHSMPVGSGTLSLLDEDEASAVYPR